MSATAASLEEVKDAVRSIEPGMRLLPVAGATKPALSASGRADVEQLDLSKLSGVLEYDPAELTLTALAGTPVREVEATLAEHHQYLPFDPPLVAAGATLGGVVAAGTSGAGAWRYGGVRDFVIGVRFIDGTGRLIAGGGKVVKNAAGFDLPKLMVGSIGRLGVLVQLSFKVFPRPPATTTLEFAFDSTARAVAAATALARGPVELDALDILPDGRLLARLGGRAETLGSRRTRLAGLVDAAATRHDGEQERALWRDAAELAWAPANSTLVRVGLSTRRIVALDAALGATADLQVRYGIGGTVAWISWPAAVPLDHLDAILHDLALPGMVLLGPPDRPLLGPGTGGAFGARISRALDPNSRFLEV
ncbi:MAG TPA: FAD-binding protein [Solirubrobacteraceae bacterium]|jgi:glycolate oxidase FAD binding subunit|nr:FAD-binding protein [Solirubrobacteraceae bacterium]